MSDERRPDEAVGDGMSRIAERMLARHDTDVGPLRRAMTDEERRRAYVLTAVISVGAIVAGLVIAFVLLAIDR